MKNKYYVEELINTIKLFARELSKNESFVSHIFLSLIYSVTDIKSYELIPQGKSKKGLIDFLYLPRERKEISYTIELKRYKSINKDRLPKAQMEKYLKSGINELQILKRKDTWRVGIISDLNSFIICLRKMEKNNKTGIYYDDIKVFDEDFKQFANTFKETVNEKIEKIAYNIFWKKRENRFDIVKEELSKSKIFHKSVYDCWLKQVSATEKQNINGGRGWPEKFQKACKYALENSKIDQTFYSGEVRKVFGEKKIIKEIKTIFEDKYGVNFNHLKNCNIFTK